MIDEVPAAPAVRSAAANGTSAPHAAPTPAPEFAARPCAAANGSSVASAAQEPALQTKCEASPAANGGTAAHAAGEPDTVTEVDPRAAVAAPPHAREAAVTNSEHTEDPLSASAPQAARPAPCSSGQHAFTEAFGLEGGGEARGANAPAIGPAMPPNMGLPNRDSEGPDERDNPGARAGGAGEADAEGRDEGEAGVGEGAAGRGAELDDGTTVPARVVGPAVPSAELLRAAAEATEAVRFSPVDGQDGVRWHLSSCSHERQESKLWAPAMHAKCTWPRRGETSVYRPFLWV